MATFGEVLDQARQLLRAGQLPQAEALYRRLIETVPQAADPWHELGLVQLQGNRPDRAADCLRRAIALDPNVAAYHANLGMALRAMERSGDAVASFEQAAKLETPTAAVYNNWALALKDDGQTDAALATFDLALKLQPDYANAYFNRGNLLMEVGRLDAAVDSYQQAIRLNPDDSGAHCKLGVTYVDQGRLDESLESFERALTLRPNYAEVRRNRALVWLAQGDFAKGWREFEWRFDCEGFVKRTYSQPRWDGSSLAGRTLLVYAEQGLGDTLHFIRYVPLAAQAGGRVMVEVQPALVPLLTQSGFGPWLVPPEQTSGFDRHCPLLSLAGMLGEAPGEPFWPGPYLAAEPRLTAEWGARLQGISGFKVGIVWAGNPDHPHDRFRSVALARFAPLAAIPGVRLIGLQKGIGQRQIAELAGTFDVIDLSGELDEVSGPFMDSAAVMAHLDLVIAVDTAAAHLAGGLGAKVWVPLQFSPDWRWLTRGQTTPWYPSMRLFRQREFDCWPGVFEEMAGQLRRLVAETS